jgi:hypothetical protein
MDASEAAMPRLAIDTSLERTPVAAVRFSRGRTGGTTVTDLLIQRGRAANRLIVIADGDLRNSTLSGFYPPGSEGAALQPPSDDLVDMKDFLTNAFATAIGLGASLVADFGGGDRVMLEYGRELALVELCGSVGMEPLALYVTGPEMDDFEHVLSIWRSEVFRPKRSLLFMNEHLVPHGRTPAGAFTAITSRPELREMMRDGLKIVLMPRLPCMAQMRDAELSLLEAMAGKPGNKGIPLDPVRQFMVRHWLKRLEAAFAEANVLDWLP